MHDQYGFNPRKCNSASTLSGCIEREMLRVIIALPTSNVVVDIFEQTITGGFSSVNTRLAFDTEILLPNLINQEKSEEKSEENQEFQKNYDYKICYNIRLNNEKEHSKKKIIKIKIKRVITKILKLDENNQHGCDITKPLPTSCIKQNKAGRLLICCCKMLVFMIRLVTFMWLILNLFILKPQKNK